MTICYLQSFFGQDWSSNIDVDIEDSTRQSGSPGPQAVIIFNGRVNYS